jgi:hypothetical protein
LDPQAGAIRAKEVLRIEVSQFGQPCGSRTMTPSQLTSMAMILEMDLACRAEQSPLASAHMKLSAL